MTINSNHIGLYSRTNVAENTDDICAADNFVFSIYYVLSPQNVIEEFEVILNLGDIYTVSNKSSLGWYSFSLTSGTLRFFKNNLQLGTDTSFTQTSQPTQTLRLGYNVEYAATPSTKEFAFATIGGETSIAIQALMYADIQAFQTTLNRQV